MPNSHGKALVDLDQLRAFAVAARAKSLTAAAGRLGLSQPGLSRRITRLETALGATLLHRSRTGLETTAAGEHVLLFAESVLHQATVLRTDLAARRSDLVGGIHLSASTVPAEQLIPPMLKQFLDDHPWISVDIDVTDTKQVVDAVRSRGCDAGFCGYADSNADLTFHPVGADEIVLAVRQDHRLAGHATVHPSELADERLVTREAGSGTRRAIDEALGHASLRMAPVAPTLSLGSTQAVIAAVRSGLGVGLVSSLVLRGVADIRPLPLAGVQARRLLYLVYERHRLHTPAVEALLGFARTWADTRADVATSGPARR